VTTVFIHSYHVEYCNPAASLLGVGFLDRSTPPSRQPPQGGIGLKLILHFELRDVKCRDCGSGKCALSLLRISRKRVARLFQAISDKCFKPREILRRVLLSPPTHSASTPG